MLKRLIPQTVVGQLLLTLTIVLSLGQVINLALLVGDKRLESQLNAYRIAVEYSAQLVSEVPDTSIRSLPYRLEHDNLGPRGNYFLSQFNRAIEWSDAKPMPKAMEQFKSLLQDHNIAPLQTFAMIVPHVPESRDQSFSSLRAGVEKSLLAQNIDIFLEPLPGTGAYDLGNGGPLPKQEIRLSAEIHPGIWFNAIIPYSTPEAVTSRVLISTSILLGMTLLSALFFARRISKPLSNFTKAAELFGRGRTPQPLAETGPIDIRDAATAFNAMQNRQTRLVDTQRTMLRSIGHDLRTPLTSLRLRAETIDNDTERKKFIRTLEDMMTMTEEILSWAKDASGMEEPVSVDLGTLLLAMSDDYQDQGRDVSLRDFRSVAIEIRRVSIKRALTNLIDNALKYGTRAKLSVDITPKRVFIHIDDDGPGIPDDDIMKVREPFFRLDNSNGKHLDGTGLGLSITETIVQVDGGKLILSNRAQKGFRATVCLPR